MIIRVQGHVVGVVLGRDEAGVAVAGEVEEDVREGDGNDGCKPVHGTHIWPCRWKIEVFTHD